MSTISKQKHSSGVANKIPYWERLLVEFIDSKRNEPFVWGSNDCIHFVNEAYKVQYGFNLFQTIESAIYHDLESSLKVAFQHLGTIKLDEATDKLLTRINTNFLQFGDIAFIDTTDFGTGSGSAFGLYLGEKIACLGLDGLVFVDRGYAKFGWRT